jgi:hypothetical protein
LAPSHLEKKFLANQEDLGWRLFGWAKERKVEKTIGSAQSVREQSTIHPPAEILVPRYILTVEAEVLSLPLLADDAVNVVLGLAGDAEVADALTLLNLVSGSGPMAATTLFPIFLRHTTLSSAAK